MNNIEQRFSETTDPKEKWALMTKKFLKSKEWYSVRTQVYETVGKKCLSCGSADNIHCDHVIPRVKDHTGSTWLDPANLQPLCGVCNEKKGQQETDFRNAEQLEELKTLSNLLTENNKSLSFDVKGCFTQLGEPGKEAKKERKKEGKRKANKVRAEKTLRNIERGQVSLSAVMSVLLKRYKKESILAYIEK